MSNKLPAFEIWGGDLYSQSYWDCGPDEHLGDYTTYADALKALEEFWARGYAAFIREKNSEKNA